MSDFVNTVDIIGDEALCKKIIERSLEEISDNLCVSLGNNALRYCENLKSCEFINVKETDRSAFGACESLTNIVLPNIEVVGEGAFGSCKKLVSASFPKLKHILSNAFENCSALKQVDLPLVQMVYSGGFYYCTSLEEISLPACTKLHSMAFSSSKLKKLILQNEISVCELSDINCFDSTPIESGTGYIYVPDALVDDYKAATNWSTYADQIKPLSELEGNT